MSTKAELVHVWYHCHECGSAPIVGRRWTCTSCPAGPDNDLCDVCHGRYRGGLVRHPAEGSLASVSPGRLSPGGEHVFVSSEGCPLADCEPWLEPTLAGVPDPSVADGFVVRPEFRAGVESFIGSYAFVVDAGGPVGTGTVGTVLLTALHIMDELIKKKGLDVKGSNADYTGRELPAVVTSVQLYDAFAVNWVLAELGPAGPMLVLPESRLGDEEPDSHRDIAAFQVKSIAPFSPGRLAVSPPGVGDPVWLAARPQADLSRRTVPAVVVKRSETALVFRFADPALEAKYSSGAPLLNAAGEVVGINVGGGWLAGHKLGHANHVGNIRRHLHI